jgi:hypothetical protein
MITTIVCFGLAVILVQLFIIGLIIHLGNSLHTAHEELKAKVVNLTAVDSKFESLIEQMR